MRLLLEREGKNAIAIGAPGAGIWKDAWVDPMIGREVVICYDKDAAGIKGTKRVWNKLHTKTRDDKIPTMAGVAARKV